MNMHAISRPNWIETLPYDLKPIAGFDRERDALLTDGSTVALGYWADGQWWSNIDGLPHPAPGFNPTHFAILSDDQAEHWALL